MAKKKFWIPRKKHGRGGLKKGALSKQLGIPEEAQIPMSLLEAIKKTPIGETIYHIDIGNKGHIKVTPLLKKRAVLAHTLKKIGWRR